MGRAATTIWAIAVLALGVLPGLATAQVVGTEDDQAPDTVPAADETPSTDPPDATDALEQCEQDRTVLADTAIRLRTQLDAAEEACEPQTDAAGEALLEQLAICEEDLAQGMRTNVALNDRVLACEAQREQNPALVAELADAQAEIEALTARLAEFGYSAEPGFRYVDGDASGSFATTGDLPRLMRGLPLLSEAECGDALDWLDAQEGPNRPLRRVIWVWQNDQPLLCARDRTGGLALIEPRANDEAHAIVFQ